MTYISGQPGSSAGSKIGEVSQGIGFEQLPVNQEGVESITLKSIDDAGDGTVEGDVNATDFTTQTGTTFASILPNYVTSIVHKSVLYSYTGPTSVDIGVGGTYLTTNDDYIAQGTADHSLLGSLSEPDQHPISAITGLDAQQAEQDQNLIDHEVAANPHDQYVLNDEGLATWVLAAYGSIGQDAGYVIGNLPGGWTTLEWDLALVDNPRGVVQDFPNNSMVLEFEGVWQVSTKVSLEFDESNAGRKIYLRFFNLTDNNASGPEFVYFVGRNQAGVNLSVNTLFQVDSANINDQLQLQISGQGDLYTNVQNIGATWALSHVSEAQFLTT